MQWYHSASLIFSSSSCRIMYWRVPIPYGTVSLSSCTFYHDAQKQFMWCMKPSEELLPTRKTKSNIERCLNNFSGASEQANKLLNHVKHTLPHLVTFNWQFLELRFDVLTVRRRFLLRKWNGLLHHYYYCCRFMWSTLIKTTVYYDRPTNNLPPSRGW